MLDNEDVLGEAIGRRWSIYARAEESDMEELELEACLDDQRSEDFRTDADWAADIDWEELKDRRMN
jgi:hypothetical protein